jgi:hypothetical protein
MNDLTPLTPVESGTAITAGDPHVLLAELESKAELAGRFREAMEAILVAFSYPRDWTIQGGKACLASAGAERIGRNFMISYSDVKMQKQSWDDADGPAYRFMCSGYASLGQRSVYAEGSYSTRDEFLGKANGSWRPLEEINEGDIRSAAHHIFMGAAIKQLLGIRNIPEEEFRRIMDRSGRKSSEAATVNRGSGTEGGTSADDGRHQKELAELCLEFANSGQTVEADGDGDGWKLVPLSDSDGREAMDIAKGICKQLSGFVGKDGKTVDGKDSAKALKGKWLSATVAKARKLKESQ